MQINDMLFASSIAFSFLLLLMMDLRSNSFFCNGNFKNRKVNLPYL